MVSRWRGGFSGFAKRGRRPRIVIEHHLARPNRHFASEPLSSLDSFAGAIAEAESGVLPNLPRIKVCSIDPASKQLELKLDFGLHADKLERSWTIAGMSFDKQGKSLVVGFTGQPFLMVFALPDGETGPRAAWVGYERERLARYREASSLYCRKNRRQLLSRFSAESWAGRPCHISR